MTTITLQHLITSETRVLEVLHAEANWKLLIRWELAGLYLYDTQKGFLLIGRRTLPWVDAVPPHARRLWHRMKYPEKQLPDAPYDPLLEETVKRQGAA